MSKTKKTLEWTAMETEQIAVAVVAVETRRSGTEKNVSITFKFVNDIKTNYRKWTTIL